MGETRSRVLRDSKRKAVYAGAATATAALFGVLGWPVVAVGAAVPAAVLTYRWWKHRTENGIKF